MENLWALCASLWEMAVVAFLATWLLLSLLAQVRGDAQGVQNRLRRWDPLGLVPRWTFFAPDPGGTDLHLFYRDLFPESAPEPTPGEWVEVPLAPPRGRKILVDAARALFQLKESTAGETSDARAERTASLQITLPYLLLLQQVSRLPKPADAPKGFSRQFQITESYGFFTDRPPVVIFRSEVHRV